MVGGGLLKIRSAQMPVICKLPPLKLLIKSIDFMALKDGLAMEIGIYLLFGPETLKQKRFKVSLLRTKMSQD